MGALLILDVNGTIVFGGVEFVLDPEAGLGTLAHLLVVIKDHTLVPRGGALVDQRKTALFDHSARADPVSQELNNKEADFSCQFVKSEDLFV